MHTVKNTTHSSLSFLYGRNHIGILNLTAFNIHTSTEKKKPESRLGTPTARLCGPTLKQITRREQRARTMAQRKHPLSRRTRSRVSIVVSDPPRYLSALLFVAQMISYVRENGQFKFLQIAFERRSSFVFEGRPDD
ncbi:hypothetical protein EVAR_11445_1 [Eumeta japonica]|uniref:Uncharacterized protein n=1 Tax=Eumeta variegata TaxID=151549 RepID=A0A4C1TNF0_EUMVA|nr:hypothetical protein EVAR_11445_1 [Eumeta japonica]